MRAGVEAAHAAGLTVGSHASNPAGITNAARAGVDSVEHGVLVDDASAAAMAEAGTTFVPTLSATHLFEPHAGHASIPDYVRETFKPSTEHDGGDGDNRALRYLEWSYDPDDTDTTYTTDYVYLLREGNQPVQVEHDRHICGLFPRAEWLRLLREIGFQAEIVRDQYERDLFVARRPNV